MSATSIRDFAYPDTAPSTVPAGQNSCRELVKFTPSQWGSPPSTAAPSREVILYTGPRPPRQCQKRFDAFLDAPTQAPSSATTSTESSQAPRRLGAFITGRYYEEDVQLTFRSGVLTKRPNGDGEMTYTSPAVRAQLEPWKLSDAKIRLSPEAQTATRGPQMRLEMAWRGREDPEDYIVSFELTEDQYKRLTRGPSAGFTQRAREMYRSDTLSDPEVHLNMAILQKAATVLGTFLSAPTATRAAPKSRSDATGFSPSASKRSNDNNDPIQRNASSSAPCSTLDKSGAGRQRALECTGSKLFTLFKIHNHLPDQVDAMTERGLFELGSQFKSALRIRTENRETASTGLSTRVALAAADVLASRYKKETGPSSQHGFYVNEFNNRVNETKRPLETQPRLSAKDVLSCALHSQAATPPLSMADLKNSSVYYKTRTHTRHE